MKLRTKSLLIIGGARAGLLLIVYISSRFIFLGSYSDLENENVRVNLGRALKALDNELAELDVNNYDEASWDDTYTFIVDRNEDYIEKNLADWAFINRKLNLKLFVNVAGEVVFSKGT
jgi:sensor domain CHASE-containing protein